MVWTVYIDESGDFTGTRTSHVAGFLTQLCRADLQNHLERLVAKVAHETGQPFTVKHVHMGPLLAGNKYVNEALAAEMGQFPEDARHELADACRKSLPEVARAILCCNDGGFEFGDADPQTYYGECLVGVLQSIMQHAINLIGENPHSILVAQRHKNVLPKGTEFKSYHIAMIDSLSKEYGMQIQTMSSFHPGTLWADIACNVTRMTKDEIDTLGCAVETITTTRTKQAIVDVGKIKVNLIEGLLHAGDLGTAFRHSRTNKERDMLMVKLQLLQNDGVTPQHLLQALAIAAGYVDHRAEIRDHLKRAEQLVMWTTGHAQRLLEEQPNDRETLEAAIGGLALSIVIANHRGKAGAQSRAKAALEDLLRERGEVLGDYRGTQERVLEIRNKAYNEEFNAFGFLDIIDHFESDVSRRVDEIGPHKDELTGAMCGTIGQAYAFAARLDPDWAPISEEWFTRSAEFLNPRTVFDNMTRNYRACLFWQGGNFDGSLQIMREFAHIDPLFKGETGDVSADGGALIDAAIALLARQEDRQNMPFELLNLLRLLESATPSGGSVLALDKAVGQLDPRQHPWQLIAKWVGLICLNAGETDAALERLTPAAAAFNEMDLTIQATLLPAIGLRDLARQRKKQNVQQGGITLEKAIDQLMHGPTALRIYLDDCGAPDTFLDDVKQGRVSAIARWMPFAYA